MKSYWKVGEQELAFEKLKLEAIEKGKPLSPNCIEMIKFCMEIEDKAYSVGYENGFAAGWKSGYSTGERKTKFEYAKTGREEME